MVRANFPFTFRLARYLDAKPGQRAALDSNGLEFVYFQGRVVLKVSGFYRVAFNSMQTTQNGRAGQTVQQAVLPILQLITEQMPQNYDYDAIGFEILYDARDTSGGYDYEGHEVLTAVFNRDEAFALARAATDEERQEILSRSDVFVNGKEFELALGQPDPMESHPVQRPAAKPALERASFTPAKTTAPRSRNQRGFCRCFRCPAGAIRGRALRRSGCRRIAAEAAGGSERDPGW